MHDMDYFGFLSGLIFLDAAKIRSMLFLKKKASDKHVW